MILSEKLMMVIPRCAHLLHQAGRVHLTHPNAIQNLNVGAIQVLFKRSFSKERPVIGRNWLKVGAGTLLFGTLFTAASYKTNQTLEPPDFELKHFNVDVPNNTVSVDEGLKIFKSHLYHAFHAPFDALSEIEKKELILQDLKGSPTLIVMGATYLDALWRDKSKPQNLVEFRRLIGGPDSDRSIYLKSVETLEQNVPASIKHMVRDLLYFYAFYGGSEEVSFPLEIQAGLLKELFAKSSPHSKFYRDLSDDLFYNYLISLTGHLQKQGLLGEGREGCLVVPLLIQRFAQQDFIHQYYGLLEKKAAVERIAYSKKWASSWIPKPLQSTFGLKTVEVFRQDQKLQLEKAKLVWVVNSASYMDQIASKENTTVANFVHLMEFIKKFHVSTRLKSEILKGSRLWTLAADQLKKGLSFDEALDLFTQFYPFLADDYSSMDNQRFAFGKIFLYNPSTKTLSVDQIQFSDVAFEAFAKSLEQDKTIKVLEMAWNGDVHPKRVKALTASLSRNKAVEELSYSSADTLSSEEVIDLIKSSPPQLRKITLLGFRVPKEKARAIKELLTRKGIQFIV